MLEPSVIALSADKSKAELRVVPNTHGPVSAEDIHALLTQPSFAMLFPVAPAITKAVTEINALCGQKPGDHELFFAIAERKDGSVGITVSDDKMHASMKITSAWGGKDMTLPDILNMLKSKKIKMGLSKPKIMALMQRLSILPPGESCEGVIACGKPAINGENAVITRKVALARERLLQPQEREDGSVDMRNLGALITVKPNDLLMVKVPATLGTPGFNVHGDVLQQVPGKDKPMEPGPGTSLHPKDPNKLIATLSGQPVENRKGMQVDDMLQIKDVDVRYGHVNFKGSILITGDVHEGMEVKASGDVTVMGFVESASIEAQGDVIVSKGVIGRLIKEQQLSTHIKASGQICAQFVQYSNLEAQGNILVTKQLLHSHTTSGDSITVSDAQSRRGDLVGGIATAAKGIRAIAFGATAGTKTELFCAMHQGELKQQLKDLDDSIKSMVVAGLELEARLRKLPPKTEWQNDAGMIEQVKMMLDQKNQMAAERNKEEMEFTQHQNEVEGYFDNYFIKAEKHIFTNVEIHIGNAFNRTQREHGPCVVKNVNQEVSYDYSNR
ncbi:DUF342 domain-containing protein [Shewanella litoralis]|uniref:Flagellar Assembly Protein A N-terminal region domain-containing protein n=1 Tax=Shewanella litoralis TaxID=2282700 RepID=A0ABQ2RC78_9GAMM|nr:FapA family protein [Shewanella litoralis]GGQ24553.1 hypothetical protein GCM10009411_25740 [Shewanella litoralis]